MIKIVFENGSNATFTDVAEIITKGNDYLFDCFGQLYSLKGNSSDVRKKINDRKELYNRWIKNLDAIDNELQLKEMAERKDLFKSILAKMTPEEREEYLKSIA